MRYQIVLIGEAWGEQEERERAPFQGPAGYHLTKMLAEAGLDRREVYLTNVFNLRPRGNRISELCGPKANGIPGYTAIETGKYVSSEYLGEIERLGDELVSVNPNLVIAAGNVPLWALANTRGITKLRGTLLYSTHCASGFKVLPTFHPASIFPSRSPENRPIIVADFMKATEEQTHPHIIRPPRLVVIEPSLSDALTFINLCSRAPCIAVDIETSGTQVTELGLAPSRDKAIVIPFVDRRRIGRSYWSDEASELQVWHAIKDLLGRTSPKKIFQNGLYDISFLWRSYGIRVRGAEHDTMLLHHALQPEMRKSLGFLGSLYTNERAWKGMRTHKRTLKGDDT